MATIVRHAAGALLAWLVFTLEGLVGYLALLAYALITGADPGGPLAGPLLVLLAAVLGVVAVPLLVVPAALIGGMTRRSRGRFTAALVGGGTAMLLAALCAVVVVLIAGASAIEAVLAGTIAALAVVGPVAAHGATAEGGRWLARRLNRRMRHDRAGEATFAGLRS